jgi:hypothetical protein
MADTPLPEPLRRALEALTRAWLAAPLPASDPEHQLAFAVLRAYLDGLGAQQRAAVLARLRRRAV